MEKEVIDVVNESGDVVGETTRSEAYEKGLLHPAVNIVVVNSQGEIYIQERSSTKSAFPLYWDISAAEHLKSGESFNAAVLRGLQEELSITAPVKLLRPKHIQKSEYRKDGLVIKEYELVELYGTVYDGTMKIDPNEIAQGMFIAKTELKEHIEDGKMQFTPWGLEEIRFLLQNLGVFDTLISEKYVK